MRRPVIRRRAILVPLRGFSVCHGSARWSVIEKETTRRMPWNSIRLFCSMPLARPSRCQSVSQDCPRWRRRPVDGLGERRSTISADDQRPPFAWSESPAHAGCGVHRRCAFRPGPSHSRRDSRRHSRLVAREVVGWVELLRDPTAPSQMLGLAAPSTLRRIA
jgi:hypothetical protein